MKPRIPDRSKAAAARLANFSEDHAKQLVAALAEAKPSVLLSNYSAQVSKQLPDMDEVPELIQVLANLYLYHDRDRYALDAILESVLDAGDTPASDAVPRFLLEKAFGLESTLGVSAKAHGLMLSQERALCRAVVISDQRAIFGAKIQDGPKAAVLYHNLRLQYHNGNGDLESVMIALDQDDLHSLRDELNRAIEKGIALKEASSVPLLGVDE